MDEQRQRIAAALMRQGTEYPNGQTQDYMPVQQLRENADAAGAVGSIAGLGALGMMASGAGDNPVGVWPTMGLAGIGALGLGHSLGLDMHADNRAGGHHANSEGHQARTSAFGSHHPGTHGFLR